MKLRCKMRLQNSKSERAGGEAEPGAAKHSTATTNNTSTAIVRTCAYE